MIKINLEKQLDDSRRKSIEQANSDALKDVKLLLETSAKDEKEVLIQAGLYTNYRKQEALLGAGLKRQQLEAEFGKGNVKIFTAEEIKGLCVKYNLRFLHSKQYKGYIEPILGAKIVRFFKDGGVDSINWEAENNLFIMAPKNAFNLEERPVPPNLDPALFYKLSTTEGDMYALIHKWGKDFTVMRRISGIFNKSAETWMVFKTAILFSVILGITALFGLNPLGIVSLFVAAVIATLISLAQTAIVTPDGNDGVQKYQERFSEAGWNVKYGNK